MLTMWSQFMIEHTTTIVFKVLAAIVATEAVSEIIVESKFFFPFRTIIAKLAFPEVPHEHDNSDTTLRLKSYAQKISLFVHALVSCGYCVSVWVACFWTLYLGLPYWFIMAFIIHRLSNWLHVLYELCRRGRVKTVDLKMVME